MIVASLALFVALGGTATALHGHNSVFSDDIKNGQVKAADLASPHRWTSVKDNPRDGSDPCNGGNAGNVAIFCGYYGASLYGYSNYGSGFAPAGFYKDPMGVVHLKGLVKNYNADSGGAQGVLIFILPRADRPSDGTHLFGALCYGNGDLEENPVDPGDICRVDIDPQGRVEFVDNTGEFPTEYLSLDGISFRAG